MDRVDRLHFTNDSNSLVSDSTVQQILHHPKSVNSAIFWSGSGMAVPTPILHDEI